MHERMIEAVEVAQLLGAFQRIGFAARDQLVDLRGNAVAGRQVDDEVDQEADHEQRRDHEQQAADDVPQHDQPSRVMRT